MQKATASRYGVPFDSWSGHPPLRTGWLWRVSRARRRLCELIRCCQATVHEVGRHREIIDRAREPHKMRRVGENSSNEKLKARARLALRAERAFGLTALPTRGGVTPESTESLESRAPDPVPE